MLLLQLLNFVHGSRLELICKFSQKVSGKASIVSIVFSSLCYCYRSWKSLLLCNNRTNLCLKPNLDPVVLSSALIRRKLFAEIFSVNSNLDDSGISQPAFSSRTNLKMDDDINKIPKMVRNAITNLGSSKASVQWWLL